MSQVVSVERLLALQRGGAVIARKMRNGSGGTVAAGSVVIYDTSDTSGEVFTTTTTQDNALVAGVVLNTSADTEWADVAFLGALGVNGNSVNLKVDGTTDIAVGDFLSTFTSAGIAAKATSGKAGKFAIALEAYTTNDSAGEIKAILIMPSGNDNSALSASLADATDLEFGTGADAVLRWSTGDASNHSFVLGLGDSNQALHLTDKAAVATDWNVGADTHPTVYWHSNTTPASNYFTIGGHDGTSITFAMAGGSRIDFTGADLSVANGQGVIIGGTSQVTAGAASEFQVLGTALADGSGIFGLWAASALAPDLQFVKSRNATIGSFTIVQDNDEVGRLVWLPDDGVDYATEAAVFQAEVDDASPAAGDIGMAFVWESMAGGGAAIAERMRLSAAGDLSIANGGGVIIGGATQVTAGAASEFQVLGTALADASTIVGRWSADAGAPDMQFVKSRNAAIGSFTIVQDNDEVGRLVWLPDDGVDYATEAAVFQAEVDDASPAAGDVGMAFVWESMAGGGAAIAERMRLSAAGDLIIANSGGVVIGHGSQITSDIVAELQVLGTAADDTGLILGRWSANATSPSLEFVKSRNATIGSNTIVQDNDVIFEIRAFPDDGVDFATEAATIRAEVDDASPAAGDIGMAFVFRQMPGGAGAIAETLRIDADGDLQLADGGRAKIGTANEHGTQAGSNVITIDEGTSPTGTITGAGSFYAKTATNVEINWIDSAGNGEQLSTT